MGTVAAQGVRTKDGSLIEGGLVVVGVGASPRDELARDARLDVENVIVVDEFLRTSAADVFAAGDVASTWNPMYQKRIRMEHWANALNQGQTAARNMLGQGTAYAKLPYFYRALWGECPVCEGGGESPPALTDGYVGFPR